MRRLRFILILSGLWFLARGQQFVNYVSNGSFEQHTVCIGSITSALSWDMIENQWGVVKWNHYCYGAIPNTGFFYNYPRTDSAFVLFDVLCSSCAPYSSRGYARNKLKAPLQGGHNYCVKFYLNLSEKSTRAIDSYFAYFGGNELDTITNAHIPLPYLNPQISNPAFNFITDTMGWTCITGTFTAVGGEKYILIGNFKSDASTNTFSLDTNPIAATVVGLDDVSCIDLELPAYAGPDTYVVQGNSVYIGRQKDVGIDEACVWFKMPNTVTSIDTAAGIWVSPTTTSTYIVVQDICGNIKRDTVVVSISGVGLSELESIRDKIKLFPNPTESDLTIDFGSQADINKIDIKNYLGQTIREEVIVPKDKSYILKTSDLDPGIYQVHFKTPAGTVTKQFFKN